MHNLTKKELLEVRNNIFTKRGVPALELNNFSKSPFSTSWYGKDDIGGYTYELCRLSEKSHLEVIEVLIAKGDRWIQIFLNIFKLSPTLESIDQLRGVNGLRYHLPPNSNSRMRLKVDDIKGIPLFNFDFMFRGHKLKSFYSESGLTKRIDQLGDLIQNDLSNIDSFIARWHEIHQAYKTDWEGNILT